MYKKLVPEIHVSEAGDGNHLTVNWPTNYARAPSTIGGRPCGVHFQALKGSTQSLLKGFVQT